MLLRRVVRSLALAAALAPLGACSPTITKPTLLSPGTAPQQRARAEQFDPYPSTDMGPEIVGGRPIDYAVPVDEVTRSRQYLDEQRQRLGPSLTPIPAYPGGPAVVGQAIPYGAPIPAYPGPPTYTAPLPNYPSTPAYTQPAPSGPPPVEYRY